MTRRRILGAARGREPAGSAPDVIDQFRAMVSAHASHPAVVAEGESLTYIELDKRSDALAERLRSLGVERESRVGIALPRGARELVALLGTLKAGGAYVPIDAAHPAERIRLILEDARPQVFLAPSDSPLMGTLPADTKVLAIDQLASFGPPRSQPLPAVSPTETQLAYVLFTSGSTGRPKGVEISRGALANFLRAMAVCPGLQQSERLLAITTTTFDIAGLELFLPLSVGATTVIASRETAIDPRLLRERLEGERFDVLQATPTMWRLLLDAGWRGDGRLRMLCGGEALPAALAERLLPCGKELWNLYGPTETTVWSTVKRITTADTGRITIGRPIDHTLVYVLDAEARLVPPGETGEIYIGGRGLARGYLGRPELTAERFVPDPHGAPNERMYRTGDRGRLLPDGNFECLGRMDRQVKIRGVRIELPEIEAVLGRVDGVNEVVVHLASTAGAEPELCAYWVGPASRDALYQRARTGLPSAMIPTAYMKLDAFPLNTNGKIDRARLPAPQADTGPVVAPRDAAEERIAAIFSEVLGISAVGIDQNFFTLGADSVKIVTARSRIERLFSIAIPLNAFYDQPTIEHLMPWLQKKDPSEEPIVVQLRRGAANTPPLFCLLGIHLYRDVAHAMNVDRSVYGIHVPVRYQPGVDRRPSVIEIATRYRKAIRAIQPHGPYYLGGFCFGGVVSYEVARQLRAEGDEVPLVALFDADLPSATRIDQLARLRSYLGAPSRMWQVVAARVRSMFQPLRPMATSSGTGRAIEVPVEGPDADTAVSSYEATLGDLPGTRLLVFRATGRARPAWVHLDEHFGWKGRGSHVSVHDIHSDHLEMFQHPHAARLAAIIQTEMLEIS